jgi:hypothetical protein
MADDGPRMIVIARAITRAATVHSLHNRISDYRSHRRITLLGVDRDYLISNYQGRVAGEAAAI